MNRNEQKKHNTKLLQAGQEADAIVTEVERLNDELLGMRKMIASFINATITVKGDDGAPGEDGKTPQRGIDYFTDADILWFLKRARPVKGVDYFTASEVQRIIDAVRPVKGRDYDDGAPGKDGKPGKPGPKGDTGTQGPPGRAGEDGHTPAHRWNGTSLSFQNPDGTWGKEVDLATAVRSLGGLSRRGGIRWTNETPTGTINGSNKIFTITSSPTSGSLFVFLNGVLMSETEDYTLSGSTITFITAPQTGSILRVRYN